MWSAVAQRETDSESGLVYMRNRMYDPNLGRFTQQDPILDRRSGRHYTYGDNCPTSFRDPLGAFTIDAKSNCAGYNLQMLTTASQIITKEIDNLLARDQATTKVIKDTFDAGDDLKSLKAWVSPNGGGPLMRCRTGKLHPDVNFSKATKMGERRLDEIFVNTDYFKPGNERRVAATLVHEVAHWAFAQEHVQKKFNSLVAEFSEYYFKGGKHQTGVISLNEPNPNASEGWWMESVLFPEFVTVDHYLSSRIIADGSVLETDLYIIGYKE
jgi:RHS repeat-associated protein